MAVKILVVDDEPLLEYVILQLFRRQLNEKEFEFDFAKNGVEALEKLLAGTNFDMVLTDISMPHMDGLTLLERLPGIDPTLKAVVVSAYGDMHNIRIAMNLGAFDFLTKPIDFEDLKITIHKTLDFVKFVREQQHQLTSANLRLRHQAFYDSLTGLPNRNWLLEQMRRDMSANSASLGLLEENYLSSLSPSSPGSSSPFAILYLALNRYQIVKYSLGHSRGELLLAEVAHRLEICTENAGIVARVGEDTFAIWLTGFTNTQNASALAERIHKALEQPFNLNENAVFSGASIGIAFNTIDYSQPDELLRAADVAMHAASGQGTTKTTVFDTEMHLQSLAKLQLETDLQKAVQFQQFHLNYQPIISLETGQLIGFEALLRWQHPERGFISPSEFIPVAERTGAIVPLGGWVLSQAIQQLSEWRSRFPALSNLSMSVNLSGLQLFDPNLLPQLDRLLHESHLNGKYLHVEITESVLMENASAAATVLEELKKRSIQVCLDDFGTGYSNLSYLQQLPIDTLKIDRSFISGMENEGKNLVLVRTILNLANSLGLRAVAEGVETQPPLEILRSLGCDCYQGYFFSPPLATEDATALLRFIFE